jgi:predicted nucleotidyltransferase
MISLKSEITKKLLNYLFINPGENLYLNELVRKLGLEKRNTAKKIKELEQEGVIRSQAKANLKLYSINTEYPLYNEYKQIFLKTVGIEESLRQAIKTIKGVRKAYLYGSYPQGNMDSHSDIDVLIVGGHNITDSQKKINIIQKEIGREINAVNMGIIDFEKRKKSNDPFISTILKSKHIELI